MKKIVLIALCLVFAAAGSASADLVSSLGVAGDYNLFTLNSSVTTTLSNSDSEGSVAIAGNATLSNYSVASQLTGDSAKLVVGGTLSMTNGQVGKNDSGSIYAETAQSIVDFTAAAEYLTSVSALWSSLEAMGSTTCTGSEIALTGTGSELNIFTIDGLALLSASALNITASAGSTVLINVTGSSSGLTDMGFTLNGVDSSDILFNFYEAEDLTFTGVGIKGSILAASAAVSFTNGNIDGQMIVDSLTGTTTGQFHNVKFNGNDNLPAVPLPGSLLILGGGLLGLVGLRRKKA